jgi:hypothetical protein
MGMGVARRRRRNLLQPLGFRQELRISAVSPEPAFQAAGPHLT